MQLLRALGFDKDFQRLVSLLSHEDIRLNAFLKLWNDLQLDLIFANRHDAREVSEFVDEINTFLMSQLDSTHSIQVRGTAIFMLLCIYLRQPMSYRRPIRMTSANLIHARQLYQSSREDPSLIDVKFVWLKLLALKCIKLVCEQAIWGPGLMFKKDLISFRLNHSSRSIEHSVDSNHQDSTTNCQPDSLTDLQRYINEHLRPAYNDLIDLQASYNSIKLSLNLPMEKNAEDPLLRLGKLLGEINTKHKT